jgi:hypothetical protein
MSASRVWIGVAVLVGLYSAPLHGQSATGRKQVAAVTQTGLRSEGCSGCRAWVTGPDNTTIHILDLEAESVPNDYNGRPVMYYNSGFRTVVYYKRPGVVYYKHSLDTDPGPARTPEEKAAARAKACKGVTEVFGQKPKSCP